MTLFSCSFVPPLYNLRSWNKIIKKQVLNENAEGSLVTYKHMLELGYSADNFTYPILLKAVGMLSLDRVGLALHGQISKTGFHCHAFVQTALLNMYSSFRCIEDARNVFNQMPVKDVVAYNSMLNAYVSCGQMDNAMKLYSLMPSKDLFSYNIMISGYSSIGAASNAEIIFDEMPGRDIVSWNSMITAWCNTGEMEKARKLFEEMPDQNVITWNTMITGYLENGLCADAVDLFEELRTKNFKPDHLTISTVLSACAHLGSLEKGRELHIFALQPRLTLSPHVTTSLVDMYSKCGSIQNSLVVFYKSPVKDIYCWNAMISVLALHGYGLAALKVFDDMRIHRVKPDDITFIGLLSACSHVGLVQEGCQLFNCMEKDYDITPKLEHYGCIIDLLSRAGYLDQAFQLIQSMSFEPGKPILGALLGACVNYRDVECGDKVVKLLCERDENLSDGEYMMVANLYATCNQWEEANKWREMMNESGIVKGAGSSAVEVNGRMYNFLAGDGSIE